MDWLIIRNEYITTKTSCRKLAEKYNCSVSSVLQKCKAEKWVEQRNQYCINTASETEKVCAEKFKDSSSRIYECASALIDILSKTITELPEGDASAIHTCTRALKDIANILNMKSELDIQEQELRIAVLRKQTNDDKEDNTIRVVISPELEEFAN